MLRYTHIWHTSHPSPTRPQEPPDHIRGGLPSCSSISDAAISRAALIARSVGCHLLPPFGDVASSIRCMFAACSRATLDLRCYISAGVASKGKRMASLGIHCLAIGGWAPRQVSCVRRHWAQTWGGRQLWSSFALWAALGRLSPRGGGGYHDASPWCNDRAGFSCHRRGAMA